MFKLKLPVGPTSVMHDPDYGVGGTDAESSLLIKFRQHVNCAIRGENTLDHVYTNIRHAYRAI